MNGEINQSMDGSPIRRTIGSTVARDVERDGARVRLLCLHHLRVLREEPTVVVQPMEEYDHPAWMSPS